MATAEFLAVEAVASVAAGFLATYVPARLRLRTVRRNIARTHQQEAAERLARFDAHVAWVETATDAELDEWSARREAERQAERDRIWGHG